MASLRMAPAPDRRPERSNRQDRRKDREANRPENRDANNEEQKKSFWQSLPADELLETELELRQILMDHMDAYFKRFPTGEGPPLSNIKDKGYQPIKNNWLRNVSLKDWIDRRIGGEVATKMGSNGQVIIYPRTEEGNGDTQDEPMEATEVLDAKAQAAPGAILSFLEAWQETTPPSLKELQRSEEARSEAKSRGWVEF
eukprot:Skav218869  [mRNA]  locus=scaffold843:46906:61654:- [translate_table: standard]